MDILAHTLWAGLGTVWIARRRPIGRTTIAATLVLAAVPDVIQMLPVLAWWLNGGSWAEVQAFAIAMPGQEPVLPEAVILWSHTIHCIAHSAVIAAAITLLLWTWLRKFWLPLLGWWSHIVIDVFTHSADYYASPVLYPFTERGFDGIAWITPWFMVLNYLAILTACTALVIHQRKRL